jgi:hypothetical protein
VKRPELDARARCRAVNALAVVGAVRVVELLERAVDENVKLVRAAEARVVRGFRFGAPELGARVDLPDEHCRIVVTDGELQAVESRRCVRDARHENVREQISLWSTAETNAQRT